MKMEKKYHRHIKMEKDTACVSVSLSLYLCIHTFPQFCHITSVYHGGYTAENKGLILTHY